MNPQPVAKVKKNSRKTIGRYFKDEEALPGGCIFLTLSVELDHQESLVAQELTDGFERVKRMLSRLLAQGKESGELRQEGGYGDRRRSALRGDAGSLRLHGMTKSSLNLNQAISPLLTYLDGLAPR